MEMDIPSKTEPESPAKDVGGYLSALAGGKSPISLPSIPLWMLDTPMYSKLPMIPAPKGKITLYTTGLGDKLYPTPSDLDFDPNAEGLSSEYKSLHDPHLRSHYTQPATFHGLIRKKFITPEGKVICTLKEFNDYHQYLKRVHIEKLAQDRTSIATKEREERERQRQEWTMKEELSPHDKQVLETQLRKRKMLKEHHRHLLQRLDEDTVKHLRVLEEKQTKRSIERARRNLEREKKRNKTLRWELEEHIKRGTKRVNLSEDEMRHAELLKCYNMSVKRRRDLKLEDQWNRHQKIREKHLLEAARRRRELQTSFAENIDSREQDVSDKWSKQLSTFDSIRETRALKMQRQEAKIQARLEKKLKSVRKLFEQRRRKPIGGRRRRPPRHGLGGPRHYSTWPVEHALDRIELSPADGVWKIDQDRYLPTAPSTTSPAPSPTAFMEPTVTIETKERLPVSKEILGKIAEESVSDAQQNREYSVSSIEMALHFGHHYSSFITTARDLVENVLNALVTQKQSKERVSETPEAVEAVVQEPKETKLPEVIRRKSVLQLTSSTIARLVLSNVLSRAREQITAEGGLPMREVASDTTASAATKKPSIAKQASLREIPPPSPIAKSGAMSEGSIQAKEKPSPEHTSSSLLAAAVVSNALRKVTRDLEEESRRSNTSVFAEDMVWNTIRNVTSQLQKELSTNVSRELEQESQRSDTSILAEDVVQSAIRNVTSQLQKELTESGTSLIAERVVSDVIKKVARQLREMRLTQSSSSVLAEELASTAIRDATRQLQLLLPQTSSSIIAEAIAADAMKNVMRQYGAQPPQTSSSILAQAFAADALKNATRRLEGEQIVRALHPPGHTSSSLLAQAITNDTVKKVTRQLQLEREAQIPHTSSSLLAQAITNDTIANAVQQLQHEPRVPPPHSDSSLLAQIVTREVLQNVTVRIQVEQLLQAPKTDSSTVAQEITIDALQNAAAQLTEHGAHRPRAGSSRLAPVTADAALQAAKEQLWTKRASSRCRSRGSRSSSPFSPELAKSAINQTSPEPTQKGAKTRHVASDIITRAYLDTESPSPTKDARTPSPLPGQLVAESPDLELDVEGAPDQELEGFTSQAQTAVTHVVDGVLIASYQPNNPDDIEEGKETEKGIDAHRSSLLLATVNEVFRKSETDVLPHQHSHSAASETESSDSEEEAEEKDNEIIGVIENEIIAEEESVHSLAECLDGSRVEGLTSVVKKNHDKTIFEGAIIPHDKAHESVTEKVLSVEELHRDESGHLVHNASEKSIHKFAECGEYSQEQVHKTRHQYSRIVPVYHNHPLNLDEEIIAHNLSAISMKPDNQHKVPSAFSASSRNSFRNMFRPDMTNCQGSAKCLKNTLVKELSHSQHGQHDHVYGVLEQPHEDITAHHSDEELVRQEEAGGVCYLPQRRTYRAHEVIEDIVAEEENEGVAEGERVSPDALQDTKDTPAGGDFKSPTEEEVEPALPMSRASTRSIRSGKSREIKSLQSKTESQEESASSGSNKSPTKGAAKSKSITETKTSQLPASRSIIGAVIERISSIFGRKHSTKIHPGSTDDHTAEVTSSQLQSTDQARVKHDTGSKTVDQTSLSETSDKKRKISVAEVAGAQSTPIPEHAAAKPADSDLNRDQETQSTEAEGTGVHTKRSVEKPEVIQEPNIRESEPSVKTIELISPNKQSEQKEPACNTTTDNNKIENMVSSAEEAEKEKADEQIIESTEREVRSPCTGPEIMQTGSAKIEDVKKLSSVQSKPSVGGDKKKKYSKKSYKSGSESSLKEGQGRKSKTPKSSLSGTLTRPAKSSSAAFGRRSQQRSLLSASPKPRACASSPHTKTHSGHVKMSAQSSQQQIAGSEKPASLAKPSSGSSIPCVVKQRSQVTKPPSTGSIRLIKVSPAPSMSSGRRRPGKLSSASLGKLVSHKASGGSVRLIKVSPAAPTAIGSRRSSRLSTSEAVVKAYASSGSSSPTRVQRLSRDKSVSRQASRGSVQSQGTVPSMKPPQAPDLEEAKQSPAGLTESRPSSTGSFVIISTPELSPSTKDNTLATCEPATVTEAPSQQQETTEEEQAKGAPEQQEQLPRAEAASKEGERQEKPEDANTEESPSGNKVPDMPIGPSQAGQPQQLQENLLFEGKSNEPTNLVSSPARDQRAGPSSDSSGSQRAKSSRRSKSIVSAVIERLSRVFSGEKSSIEERHRSDTQIAVRSGADIQGEEERVQHSQSTGAVVHTQSASGGEKHGIQTHSRQRKSSNSVEKQTTIDKSSDSGAPMPVLVSSAASDTVATPVAQPGPVAQVSTTHSPGDSSFPAKQEPGNNHLPPVENVETTPAQQPASNAQQESTDEISENN